MTRQTMSKTICETPRLLLRELTDSDFDALSAVLGDPEVMRFSLRGVEDAEGVRGFLHKNSSRYARDEVGQWAVVRRDSGSCIGVCGISMQDVDGISEPEIGYRLARSAWGMGFATEAAAACRDYGFQVRRFSRLISIIEAANVRSSRVAEKIGMHPEKATVFHGISVTVYSVRP